jgi:protein SCO1/2
MVLRTTAASLLVLAVGVTLFTLATDRFQAFTTETARRVFVRQHPFALPDVMMETQIGEQINLADLRGRWLLIDFIYTRCTTFCLASGGEFIQLQNLLAEPLARGAVQLLSISFDPEYDQAPQLAMYLSRFRNRGPGWLAARPVDAVALDVLKSSFGITVIADSFGGYSHNAAIHIVDPHGRLVDILDMGNPGLVAQTILRAGAL